MSERRLDEAAMGLHLWLLLQSLLRSCLLLLGGGVVGSAAASRLIGIRNGHVECCGTSKDVCILRAGDGSRNKWNNDKASSNRCLLMIQ